MESLSKFLFLFIFCCNFNIIFAKDNSLMSAFEIKFQDKLNEYTNYVAKWLEDFNDRHIGDSELGRIIHYKELKPKFGLESSRSFLHLQQPPQHSLPYSEDGMAKGKNMKKMGMAMIPLIFHVGATSTWMILTSIMAAKSVAIGLALLVFKIAVSSAKVASFFTALKAKQGGHHHDYSWAPHSSDHHGYERSLPDAGSHYPADWNSYAPELNDVSPPYKTIPTYKYSEPEIEDVEYKDIKSHSK